MLVRHLKRSRQSSECSTVSDTIANKSQAPAPNAGSRSACAIPTWWCAPATATRPVRPSREAVATSLDQVADRRGAVAPMVVNSDAFGSKRGGSAADNSDGEQRIAFACGSDGDNSACDIAG